MTTVSTRMVLSNTPTVRECVNNSPVACPTASGFLPVHDLSSPILCGSNSFTPSNTTPQRLRDLGLAVPGQAASLSTRAL